MIERSEHITLPFEYGGLSYSAEVKISYHLDSKIFKFDHIQTLNLFDHDGLAVMGPIPEDMRNLIEEKSIKKFIHGDGFEI